MTDTTPADPPTLIAILIAAIKSGDTATYSQTRARLADHGIRITTAASADTATIVPDSVRLNAPNT